MYINFSEISKKMGKDDIGLLPYSHFHEMVCLTFAVFKHDLKIFV